jgi:hypothetical protein
MSWGTAVDVGDVVTGVDVDGELGPTGGVGTTLSWGAPSVVGDVVAGVGADDEPDEVDCAHGDVPEEDVGGADGSGGDDDSGVLTNGGTVSVDVSDGA